MTTTTTPRTIHFYGAKGGVGTSTAAALLALELQAAGQHVALIDLTDTGDHAAILGRPACGSMIYLPEPDPAAEMHQFDVAIIDHGTDVPTGIPNGQAVYLVTRPCYVALRRALERLRVSDVHVDGVVVFAEPDRSLGTRDIEAALDLPAVATIVVTPSVARTIDAGLLEARRSPTLRRQVAPLVERHAPETATR